MDLRAQELSKWMWRCSELKSRNQTLEVENKNLRDTAENSERIAYINHLEKELRQATYQLEQIRNIVSLDEDE
jgi:hypothetical protein